MQIRRNTELYTGWDKEDAKEWCRLNNLKSDKIKLIIRNEEQVLVIAKVDFLWE